MKTYTINHCFVKGVFWLLPDTNMSEALLVPRVFQWACWRIRKELLPAKVKFWCMCGVWDPFFFDYVLKLTAVSRATWTRCSHHEPLSFPCDSMCQKPGWWCSRAFPRCLVLSASIRLRGRSVLLVFKAACGSLLEHSKRLSEVWQQ